MSLVMFGTCILQLLVWIFCRYLLAPIDLLFNSGVSLLIFGLYGLPIYESGVLKSPAITVLKSMLIDIYLIYLDTPTLGVYAFISIISSCWSEPSVIYDDLPGPSLLLLIFIW